MQFFSFFSTLDRTLSIVVSIKAVRVKQREEHFEAAKNEYSDVVNQHNLSNKIFSLFLYELSSFD